MTTIFKAAPFRAFPRPPKDGGPTRCWVGLRPLEQLHKYRGEASPLWPCWGLHIQGVSFPVRSGSAVLEDVGAALGRMLTVKTFKPGFVQSIDGATFAKICEGVVHKFVRIGSGPSARHAPEILDERQAEPWTFEYEASLTGQAAQKKIPGSQRHRRTPGDLELADFLYAVPIALYQAERAASSADGEGLFILPPPLSVFLRFWGAIDAGQDSAAALTTAFSTPIEKRIAPPPKAAPWFQTEGEDLAASLPDLGVGVAAHHEHAADADAEVLRALGRPQELSGEELDDWDRAEAKSSEEVAE